MAKSALTGSRIRERRLQLGIKQAALARSAGISSSYLNLIEHNRRRIGGKLLVALADALQTDPGALSQGADSRLVAQLQVAAAGRDGGAEVETERCDEFAGRFPGWADLVARQAAEIAQLEQSVRALNDRMTHDPFLSTSLHDVLSTVTAIRSASAILAGEQDVDPEWQARFHRNILEDAERLTEASQRLVGYLDAGGGEDPTAMSPQEEMESWLSRQGGHIAALEGPQALDPAEVLDRASTLSPSARTLAERYLQRYAADARRLPAEPFAAALVASGMDPLAVAGQFGADLALVLRRAASLPEGALPVPVGLAICDASGALTFRRQLEGFELPRIGAACPLLPLYTALGHAMTPVREVIRQDGPVAQAFDSFAIAQPSYPSGYGGPAVVEAVMLIIPLGGAAGAAEGALSVGAGCRICTQKDCAARREPSILGE